MIAALMMLLQAAAPVTDTLPRMTLAQAISRATRLDPNYVRALGQVDNAEWGRRAAIAAFVLPSVSVFVNATKYSTDQFNIGTSRPQDVSVIADATARYELFSGRKLADLGRTAAEVDQAEATELQQRFQAALQTEADYYGVLLNQELGRVAQERVRRGEEGLTIARARVTSGAAVQSDSLQFVLELTQARLDSLQRGAALTVARLQLGRRVGDSGPVDAVPIDTTRAPDLPMELPDAIRTALAQGPQYRAARAAERAASSALKAERGAYLPTITLTGEHTRFDVKFFPDAVNVSSIALGVSLPIWDDGRREIAITRARVNRDVSRAIRADLELAARRDVTAAFEAYRTAQATTALSETAVIVAKENYRVQESRYRGGATTILDVLDAQLRLTQAEADLVQSRYALRLALAGLEAILGQRLFTDRT